MHKTAGPFPNPPSDDPDATPGLAGVQKSGPFDVASADDLDIANQIRELLVAQGCQCSRPMHDDGTHADEERDPDWGADLSELVARSAPHEIVEDGVTVTVRVKLETLVAELGRFGEIKAWIYEES